MSLYYIPLVCISSIQQLKLDQFSEAIREKEGIYKLAATLTIMISDMALSTSDSQKSFGNNSMLVEASISAHSSNPILE